ncbi:unnamed protein product [Caenorhabditis nigoni]
MTKRPATDPMELAFARTEKTDGILVVEGKKLHVNKALLSCHSDYFNTLFNADFKEKSMPEIEIEDVKFEDFATLLSLVQKDPIEPTVDNAGRLLELSERFMLTAAKRHVEHFLILSEMSNFEKLELADGFGLNSLLTHTLKKYNDIFDIINQAERYSKFSDNSKARLFDRVIGLK